MSEVAESGSLGRKTITGAAWSAGARVGQQALQLVSTAVLARLLGPGAYGVMAMANFFINFLQQVNDMGTGAAVIQREKLEEDLLDSMFWLNVIIGSLVGVLIWALAPIAVTIYREPQLASVLRALALAFPLTGLGIIQESLLIRRMEYRKLAIIELSSGLLTAVVAILLAWNGAGVWSLVGASLTSSLSISGLAWVFSNWRPRWRMNPDQVRAVASYSLNLSGFIIINYFSRNAGHLFVGRFLGATALGYYQLSYSFMLYPLQNVTGVLGRVLFSAFAKMQHDQERLRDSYLRVTRVVTAVTAPMMLGIMITIDPLVRVFLGDTWLPVAALVVILAPVGLVQTISSPVGQIYLAKGRTDLMLRVGFVLSVVQVGSYLAGIPWDVQGVVISYALASVMLFYPATAVPYRLIGLEYRALFAALRTVLGLAFTMTVVAFAWKSGLQFLGVQSPVALLVSTALVGIVVYVALFLIVRPAVLPDLLRPLSESGLPFLERLAARLSPAAARPSPTL